MKIPRRGVCPFCFASDVALTREHVIPRSWFPAGTPSTVPRVIVPACEECQSKHEDAERHLAPILAGSADRGGEKGVWSKLAAGLRPSTTEDPKEKRIRSGVLKKFLRSVEIDRPESAAVSQGLLPQWLENPNSGLSEFGYFIVRADEEKAQVLMEKFARGIHWFMSKRELPADYVACGRPLRGDDAIARGRALAMQVRPQVVDGGQVYFLQYGAPNEDPNTSMWVLCLWDAWFFTGATFSQANRELLHRWMSQEAEEPCA